MVDLPLMNKVGIKESEEDESLGIARMTFFSARIHNNTSPNGQPREPTKIKA